MKKLLILFLLTAGTLSSNAQSIEFKYNIPLNKVYKTITTMKMDVDGTQSMVMDIITKGTMTATKLEKDLYTLESVATAIKIDMDMGIATGSYDSENPSDDEMSQALGAQMGNVIGKKITIVQNNKGKIIPDTTKSEDPSGFTDAFKNIGMTNIFPDKPVKPGDTWESEVNNDKQKFKLVNKYVEKTSEGHHIQSTGEILNDTSEKTGTFTADYVLDPKTHFTISSNIKLDLEVEGQKVKTDMITKVTE